MMFCWTVQDDPKGVLTGLANEIRADLRSEIDREIAESRIAGTYEKFKASIPILRKNGDQAKSRTISTSILGITHSRATLR